MTTRTNDYPKGLYYHHVYIILVRKMARINQKGKDNLAYKEVKVSPIPFLVGAVVGLVIMVGIGVAFGAGQELVNTATNKVEMVQDMGFRDVLEEVYDELDQKGAQEETIFIVSQEDSKITLSVVEGYVYEDYEDAGHEPEVVEEYDSIMALWEELN